MKKTVRYIIEFLIGTPEYADMIGYTGDVSLWSKYKVVIVPSDFFNDGVFGTNNSMPKLPLQKINEIPLLYGEPVITKQNDIVILKADIIASSFFLLTRYEETINKKRDIHGRFRGKDSLPYRAGFIDRCVVDEYGELLRSCLNLAGVEVKNLDQKFSCVMTHDADKIEQYQNLRGFVGGLIHNHFKDAFVSLFGGIEKDLLYTFPWMKSIESELPNLSLKVFIRVPNNTSIFDKPYYSLSSNGIKRLFELYPNYGLHISYEAGLNTELIADEKQKLELAGACKITECRNHYLASREPEDMMALVNCGITDDYTMGYADVAGFRLGTCKPVKWINPRTCYLTTLSLHSLVVMDCTLDRTEYMNLNYDDAYKCCLKLINIVRRHNGEWVGLWHNSSVSVLSGGYQRELFKSIIQSLA